MLAGKGVVVTGASRGIGRAIALSFVEAGADIFLIARNREKLFQFQNELSEKYPGQKIRSAALDLSVRDEAKRVGPLLAENMFSVDILVNNAGYFAPGNIADEAEGTIEEMLAVNVLSAYYVTRSILPQMIGQMSGHIFNICSVASLKAYPGGGSYSISKFALGGFSKNLRQEMLPYNIKVSAVYPGATLTDSWGDFDNSSNRILVADDVAKMVVAAAILSPQAVVEDIVLRPQLGDL